MVLTDFAHPDSPEFAPVHTELARLYLAHKADLGLDSETDDDVANVSAITATLIGLSTRALVRGDRAWLDKHVWLGATWDRLFRDQMVMPLND